MKAVVYLPSNTFNDCSEQTVGRPQSQLVSWQLLLWFACVFIVRLLSHNFKSSDPSLYLYERVSQQVSCAEDNSSSVLQWLKW